MVENMKCVKTQLRLQDSTDKSLEAYKAASDVAVTELPLTHPICLGLALNFSVFHYEILNTLHPFNVRIWHVSMRLLLLLTAWQMSESCENHLHLMFDPNLGVGCWGTYI